MKHLILGMIAGVGLFAAAENAQAQSRYVDASSVNCRSTASTSAAIVTRFSRNQTVIVTSEESGWSLIDHQPSCWISSAFLSSSMSIAPLVSPPRASSPRSRGGGGSSSGRSSQRGTYSSGTCPCSGSRVCIGPRGGRYCITSGGNKRYGV